MTRLSKLCLIKWKQTSFQMIRYSTVILLHNSTIIFFSSLHICKQWCTFAVNGASHIHWFLKNRSGNHQCNPYVCITQKSWGMLVTSAVYLIGRTKLLLTCSSTGCVCYIAPTRGFSALQEPSSFQWIAWEYIHGMLFFCLSWTQQSTTHHRLLPPDSDHIPSYKFVCQVLDFFNSRMDMQKLDGEWSVDKVLELINKNCRSWRGEGMKVRLVLWHCCSLL